MNVLVVNNQESIISPLNIEIIKTLRGTFSSEEIVSTFGNFFFARMIIDITALQNYEDIVTYQKLSIGLPIDKIILLIPANSAVASNYFLSKLISMGFYNFTTNSDGILYLLNNPNTYKEVAHLHQIGAANDMPPMTEQTQVNNQFDNQYNNQFGNQYDNQNYNQNFNQNYNQNSMPMPMANYGSKTIGVINATEGAGASTLVYMMKKEIEQTFGMPCLAMEVGKREFSFFNEQNMVSVEKASLARELLNARNYGLVLVDLNDYLDPICDETIYLIEPSIIKLNKLLMRDRNVFSKLKNKKVIINRCTLNEADIREFANEAGIDIFYVLPPLNDRERSNIICDLLRMLGIGR